MNPVFICVRQIKGRDGSSMTIPIKVVSTKELADEVAKEVNAHFEQMNTTQLMTITPQGPRAVGRLADFLLEMGIAAISHGSFEAKVHEANLIAVAPLVSLK